MYMKSTVGIAELRQNLSRYLRRVERGERLLVTDRNRPVAELGPPSTVAGAELNRLIAEGRVSRPPRRRLPEPLSLEGDPHALSRAPGTRRSAAVYEGLRRLSLDARAERAAER